MIRAVVQFLCCRSDAVGTSARSCGSLQSIFGVAVACVIFQLHAFAQLPPDVQADRYLMQAQAAMENQDLARARVGMEKVLELQTEQGLQVPVEFYFRHSLVLYLSDFQGRALRSVRRYLEEAGREGEHYRSALGLMKRIEKQTWAGLVFRTRRRAARELPAEIKAMEFVRIPAGRFRMGSTGREADADENPVRQVRISRAFEMGKYEVTQLEWAAVMGNYPPGEVCERCPVTNVSWDRIQEFIGILNEAAAHAGQDSRYRLPTEAQWEYAARAGTTGERYASDLDAIAWYAGNSEGRVHRVGGKQANPFGLHDMLGNVWEWVQNWYGPCSGDSVTDPVGPSTGSFKVNRGGGRILYAGNCRAAIRSYHATGDVDINLGFRLAKTVQ